MIRKNDEDLLNWIYDLVIDFEDENDESGLSWDSTHEEALAYLNSIPQKDKVNIYGIYSTRTHFIVVDVFYDIEMALKEFVISEDTCRRILSMANDTSSWDWDMSDVKAITYD
jgi:hypothetical protein